MVNQERWLRIWQLRQLLQIGGVVLPCGLIIYGIFLSTPFPFIYCILPFALVALRFDTFTSALMILCSCGWAILFYTLAGHNFPAVVLNSTFDLWGASVLTSSIPLLITLMAGEFRGRQQQVDILTERLTLANQAVGVGVWEWNVDSHDLWRDDAMYGL